MLYGMIYCLHAMQRLSYLLDFLLIVLLKYFPTFQLSNNSCLCTLRKLPLDLRSEVCTLFKSEINGPIANFWDLAMDDRYIVLFYSPKGEQETVRSMIEVRTTSNFCHITSIPFNSEAIYHFHYYNGIAVTAQSGKFIRLFLLYLGPSFCIYV